MYAFNPNTTTLPTKQTTPNLLPCTINHNGPITTTSRYWSPSANDSDNTKTSYLRGRKLQGRTVKLPAGYTGLVVQKTDNNLPVKPKVPSAEELRAMEEGDEMDGVVDGMGEEEVEVKMLEQKGPFEEMVIWGHESVPENDDVYVRGVEEWVAFAEAVGRPPYDQMVKRKRKAWANEAQMHCDDQPDAAQTKTAT